MPLRVRRVSAHMKRLVGVRAQWRCAECQELLDETWECDHIVPVHAGGTDDLDNLQALCGLHHKRKTILQEEERLRARRVAGRTAPARPPLACTRCGCIVSPYFVHACANLF